MVGILLITSSDCCSGSVPGFLSSYADGAEAAGEPFSLTSHGCCLPSCSPVECPECSLYFYKLVGVGIGLKNMYLCSFVGVAGRESCRVQHTLRAQRSSSR